MTNMPKQPTAKQRIGRYGENLALYVLQQQGLILVQRNFSSRYGEIDLIMLDRRLPEPCLCFIEVRVRKIQQQHHFGDASSSVQHRKQQKIIGTAQWFLQCVPQYAEYECRFDVFAWDYTHLDLDLAISDALAQQQKQIQWLTAAYTMA